MKERENGKRYRTFCSTYLASHNVGIKTMPKSKQNVAESLKQAKNTEKCNTYFSSILFILSWYLRSIVFSSLTSCSHRSVSPFLSSINWKDKWDGSLLHHWCEGKLEMVNFFKPFWPLKENSSREASWALFKKKNWPSTLLWGI